MDTPGFTGPSIAVAGCISGMKLFVQSTQQTPRRSHTRFFRYLQWQIVPVLTTGWAQPRTWHHCAVCWSFPLHCCSPPSCCWSCPGADHCCHTEKNVASSTGLLCSMSCSSSCLLVLLHFLGHGHTDQVMVLQPGQDGQHSKEECNWHSHGLGEVREMFS